jgi:formylglycine-generating enzyme required for sulfatase activity
LGIFDIGGNVSEWTQDYYEITRSKTEEVVEDPLGPESGRFHAIRGSSWRSVTVTDLRLAYRNYSVEGDEKIGFRIARNLE